MLSSQSMPRFLVIFFSMVWAHGVFSNPLENRAQNDFNWYDISPSGNLTWVDCYSGMQCARFNVPLNYSDPVSGSTALALIRIPSAHVGTPAYRGPVIFNPGGPGGSGVNFTVQSGSFVAQVIGEEFDFVSIDPRGVGFSTPNISFFKTDVERASWDFSSTSADVNASLNAIPHHWASAQVLGHLAADRDDGILNHLTTDNLAHDMLTIIHAYGQEKLQYWGISYGSVVGATFAAMFPDKVERLIIDGVLDTDGYYGTDLSGEFRDTDKVLQAFFDGCHEAGPDACAFYAPSPDLISANLTSLYNAVRTQPIPAYAPLLAKYGVVDYATLKNAVLISLYSPYNTFSLLAQGLADLARGNGSTIYQLTQAQSSETITAITCTDGEPVHDGPAELQQYYERVSNISSFSGLGLSVGVRIQCSGWRLHPQHFSGPITGNTSFPMLLIGNTADPVAPLFNANKVSDRFPGSIVLTQDSPGHTSFTLPSSCTLGYVQQYFVNGTLPPKGTICPVNGTLFPPAPGVSARGLVESRTVFDDIISGLKESFRIPLLPYRA